MCVIVEEEECDSDNCATASPPPPPLPPKNFGIVEDNSVYRSAFPQPSNFPFLQSLNLKSILCLCTEPYPEENMEFMNSNGIKLFQFGIEGTKEPPPAVLAATMTEALKAIIDVRNHPVLIHCKSGKHRTGCLVGCLRILQNWRLSFVFDEYILFAGTKSRSTDLVFLGRYDASFLRQCLQSLLYKYLGRGCRKKHLMCGEEEDQFSLRRQKIKID